MNVNVLYRTRATATGGWKVRLARTMVARKRRSTPEELGAAGGPVCPYSNATRNNVDVGLAIA